MQAHLLKPIAILGAGSWGTALALYLSRRGQQVRIWSIDETEVNEMTQAKEHRRYLPGHKLPDKLQPCILLDEALKDVEDVLIAVPSSGFRQTLNLLAPVLSPTSRIICATKGIDASTGQLLNKVANEILGERRSFALLSGPSFAREVAAGLPCSVMIASEYPEFTLDIMLRFNSAIFRTYPTDDLIGVEVGGIIKNVIAIATGLLDGQQLGANARSALITKGVSEMICLGKSLGGKLETLIGLSGIGDLILTCSDDQSRNRRLGLAIGKGQTATHAEKEIGQIIEGKSNAESVVKLAKKHHLNLPICETVWSLLQEKISLKTASEQLLN